MHHVAHTRSGDTGKSKGPGRQQTHQIMYQDAELLYLVILAVIFKRCTGLTNIEVHFFTYALLMKNLVGAVAEGCAPCTALCIRRGGKLGR